MLYIALAIIASVAEWSIASDCKSDDLWSTQVQILPGAQLKIPHTGVFLFD